MVLEDIEATSRLLEQVPAMGFDSLRPVIADHGLSGVGTLAELKARSSKALGGRWVGMVDLSPSPVDLRQVRQHGSCTASADHHEAEQR